MRFGFCSIIFLLCQVAIAQPSGMKINTYDINANLDLSTKKMFVDIQLNIQRPDTSSIFIFLLCHFATLESVRAEDQKEIPFSLSKQDTLTIRFPKNHEENSNFTIFFSYSLPADSFMVHREMYVMKRYDHWYPIQYGHLFNSTLKISVPENQITLSNGTCTKKIKSGKRNLFIWKTNSENDLALFVFNPDSMNYHTEYLSGIKMDFYFIPGLKDAQKIISLVKSSFSFYSKLLGPYQNDSFTVIELPADWFLGQGLHTLLLFTPRLLEYISDPEAWVPHEIGHQWIGNIIPIDEQSNGRWFVEESFNEYLRAMYIEHEYGNDSLKSVLKNVSLANYNVLVKEGKDVSVFDVNSVSNSTEEAQCIYAKGPMILHQLRKCIGDKDWNDLMKRIYNDFQNRIFTLQDLKIYISKYDNDGNCLKSFNDFLTSKGIPETLCAY